MVVDSTDGYRYAAPVVVQRFTGRADPSVPGFYGGAEIWVMEADGSHLRVVRTSSAGHLDHPGLTADGEHVVYSEFSDPSKYVHSTAPLYREHLYTGERRILRSIDGCSVHHNTISPVNHELSYMVSGSDGHVQLTEVEGKARPIPPEREPGSLYANGVSIPGGVVLQVESLPRASPRRISIVIYMHANGSCRALTTTTAMHRRPAISPCGRFVAWQSNERDARTDDLHIAGLDGSNHRLLTSSAASDGHPWFSRDGEWLYFESNRTGNWEIHKLNLQSGEIVQLTNDRAYANTRPRC